ncbi:lipopolysaccharide biosynthesis protein [Kozakia baliensis]|uniref:lipopolysaccharide biosynthesis protein n=1 Tax=Kozakia baliensis TaxID=153496 RepID=UPI00345B61B3
MSVASTAPPALKAVGITRVLKNLGILLGGRAVNAPLSLIHISLAMHMLGSYGFGLIAMMYAFARMMGDVVDFQSWQVVLHYGLRPLTHNDRTGFQKIVSFSLFLDGISGALGCGLGIAISTFGMNALGWPTSIHHIGTIYCISILFMTTATPMGLLRLFDRYDLIAMQGTIATIVRLIGTASLFFVGASVSRLASIWMLAEAAAWTMLFGCAILEMRKRGLLQGFAHRFCATVPDILTNRFGRDHQGIWRFAWATNFNSTLSLTFGHIGTLIVGSLLGPASAGYYRIASQVAAGIAKPVTLVQSTLYPEMARMWREQSTKRLYRMCIQIALVGGALGSLLLVVAFFAGRPLLDFMTGDAHSRALPVMLWLLAAEIVTVWGLPLEPLLFTTRKSGAAILARTMETIFFLPFLVLMIRWYGLGGVGPATLCATLILIGIQLVIVIASRHETAADQDAATC